MARVPDSMAHYATHELSELLRQLTPAQRDAIGRIVEHVYINNRPLSDLFKGETAICSENTYYKRGALDPETEAIRGPGWSHQPAFVQALETAARLALQSEQSEDLYKLRKAKRKAVDHAERAVDTWISVMQGSQNDSARNDAAKQVVALAWKGTEEDRQSSEIVVQVRDDTEYSDEKRADAVLALLARARTRATGEVAEQ